MSEPRHPSNLLSRRGLGRALETLKLGASGDSTHSEAVLCRTRRGLFVVLGKGAGAEVIDLAETAFTYQLGTVNDQLQLGPHALAIPTGQGGAARRLIALGRLTSTRGTGPGTPESYGVQAQTAVERAWLRAWLEDDERVLVWLHLDHDLAVDSDVLAEDRGEARLLVTERRAGLIAIGRAGDVRWLGLGDANGPESFEADTGSFRAGGEEIRARRSVLPTIAYAQSLLPMGAEARLLEVARKNAHTRDKAASHRARAAELLRELVSRKHPLATLTAFFWDQPLGLQGAVTLQHVDDALRAMINTGASPDALVRWWREFKMDLDAGFLVVERLLTFDDGPAHALPFHRVLVEQAHSKARGWLAQAQTDFELARHLVIVGENKEAASRVRSRLAKVPLISLAGLGLAPEEEELVALEVRREGLSLLVEALPDAEVLAARAQLEPLSDDVLAALAEAGVGWSSEAAAQVREVFAPGGLGEPDPFAAHPPVYALGSKDLDALEHEEGFAQSAIARLQVLIAQASAPDNQALKSYCRPVTERESEMASIALADAVTAFGVPGVEAFISDGKKAVGLSAYDGNPPFLLIGGKHLDADSEFFLGYRELRFALGGEVAHLRFRHTRVTVDEVWAGAWDKSRAGIDLALTVLPAFKGAQLIDRVTKIVSSAQRAAKRFDKPTRKAIKEEVIGARADELIAAHQLMQLTADRAGLVLAGDIRASLRAMMLSRPSYRAELPVAARSGLPHALTRTDDEGRPFHPELLHRIQVLVAFFLGPLYPKLRRALITAPGHDEAGEL